MKQSNDCGAKELAVKRREIGETSAVHRVGVQMSTQLMSLTLKAKGNPKYRFMSLTYLLTEGFLKECFSELKRDKATGIDGVKNPSYITYIPSLYELVLLKSRIWENCTFGFARGHS